MKFLILNTCGAGGGAALAAASDDQEQLCVIANRDLTRGNYASALLTAVREVLEESGAKLGGLGLGGLGQGGLRLGEVDAIVVMRGPGSFTGIRVGLSAAKGLAHASGVPVIALSQLAVMAVASQVMGGHIFVAMDAGRGEFYFGEYKDAGATCIEERLVTLDELKLRVRTAKLVVCESSALEKLEKLNAEVDVHLMPQPSAADCLPLAVRAFARREFASLAELDANYLRMVDAERILKQTGSEK